MAPEMTRANLLQPYSEGRGEEKGEREIEMDLFGNPIGFAAVQRVARGCRGHGQTDGGTDL